MNRIFALKCSHSADGFFATLALIPVGLLGLALWLPGFLLSIPLYLFEHVTGLCLAFGPETVLSASQAAATVSFCS